MLNVRFPAASALVIALSACAPDTISSAARLTAATPTANAVVMGPWSEPVHLDAPVSSSAHDLGAKLSDDELTIYFGSDRSGGLGGVDIWVVRRDCRTCPWGDAVDLGPNVNSANSEGGPEISVDGHFLFFSSNRPGSVAGTDDIWVSYRADVHDDLAWEAAVNLGPMVNTNSQEAGPAFITQGAGAATLYFSRAGDIYSVSIAHDGAALATAEPVAELNSSANEMEPSLRGDGKEIFFWSNRPGGLGGLDVWVSTRQNVNDPWSAPLSLPAPVNTPQGELSPNVSRDGRTLLWSATMAARPSLGFQDFWMSTRNPGDRGGQ